MVGHSTPRKQEHAPRGGRQITVPEETLHKALGGLDETQYGMLFGLDHAQLVAGGDTITKGEGGLGQALFAAGAGLGACGASTTACRAD